MPWPDDPYAAPPMPEDPYAGYPPPHWEPTFVPPPAPDMAAPPVTSIVPTEPTPPPVPLPPMQPGLGIPAPTIDQAVAAPPPPPPEPTPIGLPPALAAIPSRTDDAYGATPYKNTGTIEAPLNETPRELDPYAEATSRAAEMRDLTPEQQAAERVTWEQARQSKMAADMKRAADEDARRYERNMAVRQAGMDAAMAAQKKLDEDSARLAEDGPPISTGSKIFGVLGAIFGGFNLKSTGGRNLGLETVQSLVNDATNRHMEDMHRRQGAIGEMRAQTLDQYSQQEAYRQYAYNQVLGQLKSEFENYDPQGATAFKINDAYQQIAAQKAAHQAAFVKQVSDLAKAGADLAHTQAETQKLGLDAQVAQANAESTRIGANANATQSYASAAQTKEQTKVLKEDNRILSPAEVDNLRQQLPDLAQSAPAIFAGSFSKKDFEKRLELLGKPAKEAASQAAKDAAEQAKENRALGVSNPTTGHPILQPEGVQLIKQADALEKQAASTTDPAQAKALRDQAKAARDEAETKHRWLVQGATTSSEMIDRVGSSQTAINQIAKIQDLIKEHNQAWLGKNEGQKALQTMGTALTFTLNKAFKLGALDEGSLVQLQKLTGGDPSQKSWINSFTSFMGNTSDPAGALNALNDVLIDGTTRMAKSAGFQGESGDLLHVPQHNPAAETPQEQTFKSIVQEKAPGERADAIQKAREGQTSLGRGIERGLYALSSSRPTSEATEQFERDAGTVYGLEESKQQSGVDHLLDEYKLGGSGAESAGKMLVKLANLSDRPYIANGVRGVLREKAPELLKQAQPELSQPIDQRDVGVLEVEAKKGSVESKDELIRRSRAGDKQAQAVVKTLAGTK